MHWDNRQARFTLLIFMLLFTAGQVKAYLTRPIFPDFTAADGPWPPDGYFVDATVLKNRALEVYTAGTTIAEAVSDMDLPVDLLGSGFCLPKAGKLVEGRDGWRIRAMTQRERWVWRIPMNIHACKPEDLRKLRGIGPSLAQRIHVFVQGKGHIKSIEDLDDVTGIGHGKLKILKKELALQ